MSQEMGIRLIRGSNEIDTMQNQFLMVVEILAGLIMENKREISPGTIVKLGAGGSQFFMEVEKNKEIQVYLEKANGKINFKGHKPSLPMTTIQLLHAQMDRMINQVKANAPATTEQINLLLNLGQEQG